MFAKEPKQNWCCVYTEEANNNTFRKLKRLAFKMPKMLCTLADVGSVYEPHVHPCFIEWLKNIQRTADNEKD